MNYTYIQSLLDTSLKISDWQRRKILPLIEGKYEKDLLRVILDGDGDLDSEEFDFANGVRAKVSIFSSDQMEVGFQAVTVKGYGAPDTHPAPRHKSFGHFKNAKEFYDKICGMMVIEQSAD